MAASLSDSDQDRQKIQALAAELGRITGQVDQGAPPRSQHIEFALLVIHTLTFSDFDCILSRGERVKALQSLQQIAHHNHSNEGSQEIADWCSSEWLRVLERDRADVDALYGLAIYWFNTSQLVLHKIYDLDRSSSSLSSSPEDHTHHQERKPLENPLRVDQEDADDNLNRRLNSPEFVEARASLQPATEYFDRAVAAATQQQRLSDEMISRAAEAFISLGNTSSPRVNQRYYQRAIQLLQHAIDVGYSLGPSLQQFLDEYGRFVD